MTDKCRFWHVFKVCLRMISVFRWSKSALNHWFWRLLRFFKISPLGTNDREILILSKFSEISELSDLTQASFGGVWEDPNNDLITIYCQNLKRENSLISRFLSKNGNCSTSPPGGNQVDGSPPDPSPDLSILKRFNLENATLRCTESVQVPNHWVEKLGIFLELADIIRSGDVWWSTYAAADDRRMSILTFSRKKKLTLKKVLH